MARGPVKLDYFVLTVLNLEDQLTSSSLSIYGVSKVPPTNLKSKFWHQNKQEI